MKYTYKTNNKLNNYTIYSDGKELNAEEVIELLSCTDSTHGEKEPQPSYYTENGASPLDCFRSGLISKEEFVGFCKGNVIKYIVRGGFKDGNSALQDYGKASDYLDELMQVYKE